MLDVVYDKWLHWWLDCWRGVALGMERNGSNGRAVFKIPIYQVDGQGICGTRSVGILWREDNPFRHSRKYVFYHITKFGSVPPGNGQVFVECLPDSFTCC